MNPPTDLARGIKGPKRVLNLLRPPLHHHPRKPPLFSSFLLLLLLLLLPPPARVVLAQELPHDLLPRLGPAQRRHDTRADGIITLPLLPLLPNASLSFAPCTVVFAVVAVALVAVAVVTVAAAATVAATASFSLTAAASAKPIITLKHLGAVVASSVASSAVHPLLAKVAEHGAVSGAALRDPPYTRLSSFAAVVVAVASVVVVIVVIAAIAPPLCLRLASSS